MTCAHCACSYESLYPGCVVLSERDAALVMDGNLKWSVQHAVSTGLQEFQHGYSSLYLCWTAHYILPQSKVACIHCQAHSTKVHHLQLCLLQIHTDETQELMNMYFHVYNSTSTKQDSSILIHGWTSPVLDALCAHSHAGEPYTTGRPRCCMLSMTLHRLHMQRKHHRRPRPCAGRP